MFLVILLCIRRQDFIYTVSWTASILARSNVGNDLGNLSCRSLNRLGTFYLCISNLKTIFQHTFKINQTAIGHRCIGTVVQIVIVDIPFWWALATCLGSICNPIDFPTIPAVKSRWVFKRHRCLLLAFFIDNCLIFIEQLMDTKVNICRFWALKIPLCPISNILLSQGIFFDFKKFNVLRYFGFHKS